MKRGERAACFVFLSYFFYCLSSACPLPLSRRDPAAAATDPKHYGASDSVGPFDVCNKTKKNFVPKEREGRDIFFCFFTNLDPSQRKKGISLLSLLDSLSHHTLSLLHAKGNEKLPLP